MTYKRSWIEGIASKVYTRAFEDEGEKRFRLAGRFAGGDILDIGCALNPNPYLRGNVIGFDLLEPRQVLPTNYHAFVRGDVSELDDTFASASFDSVVSLEIIEHLPDHCRFMDSVARLVRPGGNLIIATPNPFFLITMIANSFFPRGLSASATHNGVAVRGSTFGPYYTHIHLHVPRILNLIASDRGLCVRKILASTGWNVPFLAASLMYVYEKQ